VAVDRCAPVVEWPDPLLRAISRAGTKVSVSNSCFIFLPCAKVYQRGGGKGRRYLSSIFDMNASAETRLRNRKPPPLAIFSALAAFAELTDRIGPLLAYLQPAAPQGLFQRETIYAAARLATGRH